MSARLGEHWPYSSGEGEEARMGFDTGVGFRIEVEKVGASFPIWSPTHWEVFPASILGHFSARSALTTKINTEQKKSISEVFKKK